MLKPPTPVNQDESSKAICCHAVGGVDCGLVPLKYCQASLTRASVAWSAKTGRGKTISQASHRNNIGSGYCVLQSSQTLLNAAGDGEGLDPKWVRSAAL